VSPIDHAHTPPLRCSAAALVTLLLAAGCTIASGPLPQAGRDEVTRAAASAPPATFQTIADQRDDGRFDYLDGGLRFDPAIPTPQQVLGYRIGEHFTRDHDQLRYLERLAATSPRVRLERYGESHQRRPLHLVTISAPANLERLDEILEANRRLARRDLPEAERRRIEAENPAIAWFSYTVHGNEGSTSDSALRLVYTLAAARNPEVEAWLDEVVVVVDPLLNPDGFMRYVNWFENVRGATLRPEIDAAEHHEPWPGGRGNHYLFDLNRDWLWLVHPESRSRLAAYRRHLPHLHIDFHEQGHMHPYFLGAGDEPYNANIPASTRAWIELYGDANAAAFDARGLMYSSRERFDYMYPGYGKVLPVYHGAVGMLAEQAGHSRAGLAIAVNDDYTLTLAERADNHFLLAMNNVETTARHRQAQLERFGRFFLDACDPTVHPAAAYAILPSSDPDRLAILWDLLESHGIEVHALEAPIEAEGLLAYDASSEPIAAPLPEGTWVVRADQPLGHLVSVLFERDPVVSDPDTYDITAWSVPVAFGLDAYQSTRPIEAPMRRVERFDPPTPSITGDGSVALLISSAQHRFPVAFGIAAELGLHARLAGETFEIEGLNFPHGSMIVHGVRNTPEAMAHLETRLLAAGLSAHRAARGMTDSGPVLGANANRPLQHPRIALLRGRPLNWLSYGQIWHLLDVAMPLPHTPIDLDRVGSVDLSPYSVVVVPASGSLDATIGSGGMNRLKEWVRAGGTLVVVGGSANWAARSILGIDRTGDAADEEPDQAKLADLSWAERRERGVEGRVPGALLLATVDETHPLSAGLGPRVGIIKRGASTLPIRDSASVVARFEDDPRVGGSISQRRLEALAGTPLMTMHGEGRGRVISIVEDPTLRGFNHHPARMLLNAITLGPSQ